MYYIINRIELVDGVVVTTPVNYTLSSTLADELNLEYENTLEQWVKNNMVAPLVQIEGEEEFISDPNFVPGNIEDFFALTPFVLSAKQVTTDIEGMNLIEI